MAKIDIVNLNKETLRNLKHGLWKCDINFINFTVYEQYIENGFDPEGFQITQKYRNSTPEIITNVLIKNIPYKDFKKEEFIVLSDIIVDENGHVRTIKSRNEWQTIHFGDYSFEPKELGELLNELLEAKRFKKDSIKNMAKLSEELSKGTSVEEAYKIAYGVEIKK